MENPTTVNNTNWGKFCVFSNHLLVVVRRSMRSSRKYTLRSSLLDLVALCWSNHIWHNDWAFILLADARIEDGFSTSAYDALLLEVV